MIFTLVPLGNPGEKYARTRHNAARVLIDMIRDDIKNILECEIFIPETFMNESGKSVSEYMRYHEGRELVVIYDDKDLPCGTFRISFDRGSGGHNGIKSIIDSLGAKDFIRIRIGIAPHDVDGKIILPPSGMEVQDYVMGKIREDEEESLRAITHDVLGAIKTIIDEGYQKAMERYN
ncbi:MAG: aminoacyl-tRNA hydrolase [Candidatus Paceibacterota bacterium]|jgi:PTH1 family peptidyl-tRNA hydrolase